MPPFSAANIAPISPEWQLGLLSVLGILFLVLSILGHFKRKPPVDSQLVALNTTIEGLKDAVEKLTATQATHASHSSEIQKLQDEVKELRAHREADLRSQREYTRQSGERIFSRIDELDRSVNNNFQSVERAIGNLEGRLAATRT